MSNRGKVLESGARGPSCTRLWAAGLVDANLGEACGVAGSKDIVEQLLAAGADPTIAAAGGATPLHAAAEAGQLDIVLMLLQADMHLPPPCCRWLAGMIAERIMHLHADWDPRGLHSCSPCRMCCGRR